MPSVEILGDYGKKQVSGSGGVEFSDGSFKFQEQGFVLAVDLRLVFFPIENSAGIGLVRWYRAADKGHQRVAGRRLVIEHQRFCVGKIFKFQQADEKDLAVSGKKLALLSEFDNALFERSNGDLRIIGIDHQIKFSVSALSFFNLFLTGKIEKLTKVNHTGSFPRVWHT